jgi:hypothetical protein
MNLLVTNIPSLSLGSLRNIKFVFMANGSQVNRDLLTFTSILEHLPLENKLEKLELDLSVWVERKDVSDLGIEWGLIATLLGGTPFKALKSFDIIFSWESFGGVPAAKAYPIVEAGVNKAFGFLHGRYSLRWGQSAFVR